MTSFHSMFVLMNVVWMLMLSIATFKLCKGEPWSLGYLTMAVLFLLHGCFALESFDVPMLFEKIKFNAGTTSAEAVEQVKAQIEFWKLSIPVISLGVGCSMVNSFFSSSKPTNK